MPVPGQLLDRYVFERRVGVGGMAEVWSARHQQLGTRHALKVLLRADPEHERRLLMEGRAQATLKHPYLLPVHDIIEFQGRPVLLMPYVDGPSLATLMAHHRLSRAQALALFAAITQGLDHAHGAGFIHRDVKPGNVLLQRDPDGVRPRLADFGLVKRARGSDGGPQVFGTPAYAAPEQLRDATTVDARADLFSLGVLLVAMLTGRPATADAAADLSGVDADLAALARSLLQPDPRRRPADCRAVLAALGAASGGGLSDEALRDDELNHAARTLRPAARALRPASTAEAIPLEPDTLPPRLVTGNLPSPSDRLIGRVAEVTRLAGQLRGGERVLTVSGPGGVGKTRLALAVAHALSGEWSGGVWFVSLAEARGSEGILAALAEVLDAPTGRTAAVLRARIAQTLARRGPLLIVLDNAEQVAEPLSEAIPAWRAAAPEARFLITSRAPLQLRGERVAQLAPLSRDDAIALFADRAAAAHPGYALTQQRRRAVEAIVTLLDGLPLAIVLAAARTRELSADVLLERLTEQQDFLADPHSAASTASTAPPRQRTIQATLQWSWDLLEPEARSALAQCSVFQGGFTLQAAEAVLVVDDGVWLEELLADLVDWGLLRGGAPDAERPRLSMLNLIRQFVTAQLRDPLPTLQRHGAHFARLGAHLIRGASQGSSLSEYTEDRDDLVAATRRALTRGDEPVARACALAAGKLYTLRGPYSEGAALLAAARAIVAPAHAAQVMQQEAWLRTLAGDRAVAEALLREALSASPATALEAHILNDLGQVTLELGRPEAASDLLTRALEGHRRVDNEQGIATALHNIGALLRGQGKLKEALTHLQRALDIHRRLDRPINLGRSLFGVAFTLARLGRLEEAEARYREALALSLNAGDRSTASYALLNLGIACAEAGRAEEALTLYERVPQLARQLGDGRLEASARHSAGVLRVARARWEDAEADLDAALTLLQEVGTRGEVGSVLANLGYLHQTRGLLTEAERHYREALVIQRETGSTIHEAITLTALGTLQRLNGATEPARTQLTAALTMLEEAGYTHGQCLCLLSLAQLALEAEALPADALALLQRAHPLARAYPELSAELHALSACALARLGRLEEARAAHQLAAGLLERGDYPLTALVVTLAEATIAMAGGAHEQARTLIIGAEQRAVALALTPRASHCRQLARLKATLTERG